MLIRFFNAVSNIVISEGSSEILIGDPLSESTMKSRRWLLLSSLIALFITHAHIVPTKISALGITFSTNNQEAFLRVSATVPIYFLITFVIDGLSDFAKWLLTLSKNRMNHYEGIKEKILRSDQSNEPAEVQIRRAEYIQENFLDPLEAKDSFFKITVLPIAILKGLWVFLFPVGISILSIIKLWSYF